MGIAKEAKILAIDTESPNLAFSLMRRKGYVVMSAKTKLLETFLAWDHDYVITQNKNFITDVYHQYPEILNRLEKVAE